MELKKVEVIWIDAWSDTAHVTQKMLDNMMPVLRRDVGYLRKENETEVVLAGGMIEWSKIKEEEDTFSNEQVIPRSMVKEIIPLKADRDNSDGLGNY